MKEKTVIRTVWLAAILGIVIWLSAILMAPILRGRGRPLSAVIYAAFAPTCHQIPGRSFYLSGSPLPVCCRCLGIYAGFLIGVLAYPFVRGINRAALPKAKTFILFSLPISVDTAANFFRLWSTSNTIRLIIGILWGVLLPFYFITGISELFSTRPGRKVQKETLGEGV